MLVELSDAAPAPVHKCVVYVPLPPAGVAIRLRFTPAHVVGRTGIIVAVGFVLTVIVIAFDVAGLPVGHGAIFDVNTQVTTSPLARAAFVYVGLFNPTFAPLSFH
jgi:hypothetical protein